MPAPIVDREFEELLPCLTPEEAELLEQELLQEGCRDTIKLWKGTRIILDGHNRYRICMKHRIPFETANIVLPNRAAALAWIVRNQLARRNMTDERRAYLRGKDYLAAKKPVGHPTESQLAHSAPIEPGKTSEQVAARHGVDPATIKRDAKFAQAVDTLAAQEGPEAKAKALDGSTTRKQTIQKVYPPPNAGDAWEGPDPQTNGQANGKPRGGKVVFDQRKMRDAIGTVIRLTEQCGQAHGKGGPWHAMRAAHEALVKTWQQWQKEIG